MNDRNQSDDLINDPALERDLVITRIVDGRASTDDWALLDRLARTDAAVYGDR